MSFFYNKFYRIETLPCDIQNCHPANWPIILLEINMSFDKYIYDLKYIFISYGGYETSCVFIINEPFAISDSFYYTRWWPVQARVHLAANDLKEFPQRH